MIRDRFRSPGVSARPEGRLLFLDELRGIAAVLVALFHFYTEKTGSPLHEPLSRVLPSPIRWIIAHGDLGIQVFFVLSGFVIVRSLRGAWITPGYFANFAVRRSLRLDPPYWTVLGLLSLMVVAKHGFDGPFEYDYCGQVRLSKRAYLANFLYLQDLLGNPALLGVAWTLCLEVQFYLACILLIGVGQRVVGRASWEGGRGQALVLSALFVPLFLASLAYRLTYQNWTALDFWHMFSLGALLDWSLAGQIPRFAFWVPSLIAGASGIAFREPLIVVAVVVAVILAGSAEIGLLASGLGSRALLYFGRISYSLYLVHFLVGMRLIRHVVRIVGASPSAALATYALAFVTSVAAAHLLHVAVERPALLLGKRLKRRPLDPIAEGATTVTEAVSAAALP